MNRPAQASKPRVFMMDLWATVPYYTAYLSRALREVGVPVQIGSITYYLDRDCFTSRGLELDPGFTDVVGRLNLPRVLRRALKLIEGGLNLLALTFRFLFRPPQVLHVQFLPLLRSRLPMDLWFVRFCARRGSRTVLTVHDLLPHDTGVEHKELYRRLYAEMDALICHSGHIRTRLREEFDVPEGKIEIIAHGPFFYDLPTTSAQDILEVLRVPRGQRVVLWQGIIFPYKGVDLLLEAWRLVEEATPNVTLVVLGTGDAAITSTLEEQARQLGLLRVRFHFRFCSTEELVAAYRAADAVVYPYRAITTSGALATGLALAKPIIASNLPVFRELLVDEQNALLVDSTAPDELAKAIVRIAEDSQMRELLSARVAAMQFGDQSWLHIAEKTLALYQHTLESAKD